MKISPEFRHVFNIEQRAADLALAGPLAVEIARESIKRRAHQSLAAVYSVVMACVVVGILYSFFMPPWRPLSWLIPLATGNWLHRGLCVRILCWIDQADLHHIAGAEKSNFISTCFLSLLIGSGVWWTGFGILDRETLYITTIIQCIYCIGSIINTGTHLPAAYAAIWLNLGVAACFWVLSGGNNLGAAISLAALALYLTGYARNVKRNFEELIRIRFENLDLVRKLEIEKHAAEQANLAKSRFLAAASHDLRQPLHALILFSGMLNSAEQRQMQTMISHIHNAASALDKLFGGLMDLSQLDAGVVQPSIGCVRVAPLLHSIAAELNSKAQAKGLVLSMESADFRVRTDPFLFERILRNLIDNAIKYTEQGSISVTVGALENSKVCINITDTGIGIAESMQIKIFDEFFQLNNPARNVDKGTGLGLAIVQRLCQLLNHELTVKSKLDVGSQFSLLLDADCIGAREFLELPQVGTNQYPQHLNVVIVEDDALVRFAMKSLLESWQCQAFVYECCSSALSDLAEQTVIPDALIADFRLVENSNGFEAIAAFRRQFGAQFPAAIFTGDLEDHLPYAQTMPDVPVFHKPVHPEEIAYWLIDVTSAIPEQQESDNA